MKKVAIVGAGFTGLSAALKLAEKGHQATVFEKEMLPGGLAGGYAKKNWDWTLEQHYHHWFYNDNKVLDLAKEIKFSVIVKRPKTSVYIKDRSYQLDSPFHILTFPLLSIVERIRMSAVLGFLKFNPFYKPLEKIKASSFLEKTMGEKAYQMIWEPQLTNKFGPFKDEISLAWFWARIYKRTSRLVYPESGFLRFAQKLQEEIEKKDGKFIFDSEVLSLKEEKGGISIVYAKNNNKKIEKFDFAIVTLPLFVFAKIGKNLPKNYMKKIGKNKGLGAVNMILRLKKPFFQDNTYWLSICDKKSPITAIVEHTNFMNRKDYDGEYLVYLGNYVSTHDLRYKMSDEKLLDYYDKFLSKINKNYRENLLGFDVFRTPFAQPIVDVNYSQNIPDFKTPLKNVYLANMEQVYPWDRGTNYAVEIGEKVADVIISLKH